MMQFEVSQSVQHGAPDGFMRSISSTDWKVLKQDTSVPLLEKYYCRFLSLLFSLLILIRRRFVPDPLGARRLKFEASDGISDGYDASQSEGETRCFSLRSEGNRVPYFCLTPFSYCQLARYHARMRAHLSKIHSPLSQNERIIVRRDGPLLL